MGIYKHAKVFTPLNWDWIVNDSGLLESVIFGVGDLFVFLIDDRLPFASTTLHIREDLPSQTSHDLICQINSKALLTLSMGMIIRAVGLANVTPVVYGFHELLLLPSVERLCSSCQVWEAREGKENQLDEGRDIGIRQGFDCEPILCPRSHLWSWKRRRAG